MISSKSEMLTQSFGGVGVGQTGKKKRQSVHQEVHRFLLGNPCGPCEWHIIRDTRVLVWFDLIFQLMFLIPATILFIQYWQIYDDSKLPTVTTPIPSDEKDCDIDKLDLALYYIIADLSNLVLGIFSDILLFIGTFPKSNCFGLFSSGFYIFAVLVREALHGYGIFIHIQRCSSEHWPYEFITRGISQYILWGFWIAVEYFRWLKMGRQFVPRRGLMEPPILSLKYVDVDLDQVPTTSTVATISSWSVNLGVDSKELAVSPVGSGGVKLEGMPQAGDGPVEPHEGERPKRQSRKSDPNSEKEGEARRGSASSGSGSGSDSGTDPDKRRKSSGADSNPTNEQVRKNSGSDSNPKPEQVRKSSDPDPNSKPEQVRKNSGPNSNPKPEQGRKNSDPDPNSKPGQKRGSSGN